MAEYSSRLLHLHDRLPKIAPTVILERDRFLITKEEFQIKVKICCEFWHIKEFTKFCIDNYENIKQKQISIASDIQTFYRSI